MKEMQGFRFELRPDGEQMRKMAQTDGSCRFVYNKALALQKENHEAGNKFISYFSMTKHLTEWRGSKETPWLKNSPSGAQQQALKDLDRAFTNFFAGRAEFPKFKKKEYSSGFRYSDAAQIKLDEANARIFLPKLGWVRYRKSRNIKGTLCNVNISKDGDKWFMSICTEQEIEEPKHSSTSAIGIDMGVARFATMSDGTYIASLNIFKKLKREVAKAQRSLSKKKLGSQNWRKARKKLRNVYRKVKNSRADFLHKVTTEISKNHAIVCIEDLRIGNMTKSAAGTKENPGKMVRQKSGLNRAILDQGWGAFRQMLEYKMKRCGGKLVFVPPQYSSQTCPKCHHVSKENRKTQAEFECVACFYKNHADVVAAIIILERGYRLLACGEMVHIDLSMKQEPTEATSVR